ncbi:hypothetical protein [Mitsuaria sp. 7]|uniref:hypothetical protein n=1 Tax=Mitsuaria sp. 7 TaxID=1658665 RepID=UPI0012FA67B4|nr:hypothetical protein [Mitsuaria sp. 7]
MQFNEDGQRASAMGANADLALQVQMLKTRLDVVLPTLATREQLQQEVGAIRGELKHEIGTVRAEIGSLRSEMHQAFTNTLKWGVGIALTSIVAVAAVVTAMAPMFQLSARGRDALALAIVTDKAQDAQRD